MGTHPVGVTRRETLGLLGATGLAGCAVLDGGSQRDTPRDAEPDVETTRQSGTTERETVRAFVGSYHWGYFVLDENGEERDRLTLSAGDELRLTLFNVESDAVEELPQAVRTNVPSSDERARRNEGAIPVPRGTDLETLHEAAEAAYPDHGLVVLDDEFLGGSAGGQGQGSGGGPGQGPGGGPGQGPWGGHHGPHGGYGPGGGQTPGQGWGPGSGGPYGPMGPGGCWGGYGGTLAPSVYLWHHATVPAELGFVVNTTGSFGFVCDVYCGYGHPYMAESERIVVSE